MVDWVKANSELLSLTANLGMMVVWIVYLNMFLVSFSRQNRSVIHISRAASEHMNGRCLVTNMGAQNLYLVGVVIDIKTKDGNSRAIVTDREEWGEGDFDNMLQRTLQGPLGAGEARDIGSFEELAKRAQARLGSEFDTRRSKALTITAVAAPNQHQKLVGASKCFNVHDVDAEDAEPRFVPSTLMTRQISGLFRTRRLSRMVQDR